MSTVSPEPTPPSPSSPDYVKLVQFLVQPFLESPDQLKIDCERSPRTSRVLIRLAFEGEDKGRVFGRGGRNIQAIRTVVQAIAQMAGQSIHLEVFGGPPATETDDRRPPAPSSAPRPSSPRPQRRNTPS